MRVLHRYLGFFLAGVMAVYAISGVIMIFRNTDVFKVEKHVERTLAPQLSGEALGRELRMRGFKATSETDESIEFRDGTYDKVTGEVSYTSKELPFVLKKFEQMHKATSDSPLFYLNVFFGVSLLFFVVSSFLMFVPRSKIYKKGLWFAGAGLVLTIFVVYM